jgi:tetratricopeptide (TPR) repeat protein
MDEREQLKRAMQAMESQRARLGDEAVDQAIAALRMKLEGLNKPAVLVGREPELEQLQKALQAAITRQSVQPVLVLGEAGVGKTRLVNEFKTRLDASGQPVILFYGQGDWQKNLLPYALLRQLLAAQFKILAADSTQVAREKLLRGVEAWLGPEGLETAHWIGHLAGYEFPHSPYLSGRVDDPRRARLLAFQTLNRFMASMAQRTPLLVIIDDLQWADEGSLDWIDSLARCETDGPVLLVCLARPGLLESRGDAGWQNCLRLDIQPLNDIQTVVLAGQIIRTTQETGRPYGMMRGAPTIPLRRIIARAGGSPYFIEELVLACMAGGSGSPPPGQPEALAAPVDPAHLPASLEEMLRYRIDSLPAAERELLLRAAVIGPVFWEAAVWTLMEADSEERGSETGALRALGLPESLVALQQRGLIVQHATSAFEHSEEYMFRTPLLYHAAYEGHEPGQRRKDHARVAAWLAAQNSERVEAFAAVIARHYESAGDPLLAAEWYGLAAHQARRSSAAESAVHFFNRALELLPVEAGNFAQRVHLYKALWDVQWWQAHYSDAMKTGQALLAASEAQDDQPAQAGAWNRIAAVQNRQGEYQPALRSVQRAERLARTGGAAREVVLALFNRGVTLYRLGDSAAALEAGEQALAFNQSLHLAVTESDDSDEGPAFMVKDTGPLNTGALRESRPGQPHKPESPGSAAPDRKHEREVSRTSESTRETARILSLLAMINQRAGRYAQAESDYRQALRLQRARGDRPAMVTALNNLGTNAYHQGDFRAAAGFFREAMLLTQELGYYDLQLVCLNHLAGAQVELGEYPQAEEGLREVLRRAGSGSWFMQAEVYRNLAVALVGQKRLEEALPAGLRALDLARQSRSNENIGRAWRVLGRLAAEIRAGEGDALLQKRVLPPVEVDGRICSAHDCYAASLQVFVEMGAAGEQARTMREWAANELETGDRPEGLRLWKEARDQFVRLGLVREVERMDRQSEKGAAA